MHSLILLGFPQEMVLEMKRMTLRKNGINTELIVDSPFRMNGCAFSITACSKNLMSYPILSKCISKRERREKTLFNPNCLQNEASIPLLSSVEFARRSRLDFKESAGINASIGSCAITEQ